MASAGALSCGGANWYEGKVMALNVRIGWSTALSLFAAGFLLSIDSAAAQPTQAQQNALRSNCRSDFMANCSSVKPGGAEALQCLQRNVAKLSPGCQSAVNALTPPAPKQAAPAPAAAPPAAPPPAAAAAPTPPAPPAAPAPAKTTATPPPAAPTHQTARPPQASPAAAPAVVSQQPTAQQQAALKQSCQSDFMARCRGVSPGGAEALHCLQRNSAQLSPNCRNAVAALGGTGAPTSAKTAAPAAAPAKSAAPAAAPSQPTAQQQAAIKQSCQSDFMARCRGVSPGGAQALQCLQRNSAQLSPNCRSAVAALGGGGAPAAATASAPAAAAAPTAQQQNAIKFTCRRDFGVHCRGVPQGGPEALACLQRNAARLSPDCKTSIAAISDEQAATVAPAATPAPAGAAPAGPFPLRRAIRERMLNRQ
jgi:hypothetical protein